MDSVNESYQFNSVVSFQQKETHSKMASVPLNLVRLHKSSPSTSQRRIDPPSQRAQELMKLSPILKSTYTSKLHPPTVGPRLELNIDKSNKLLGLVYLWRGCTGDQILNMARTGTAGGVGEPDINTPKPTEEEAIKQVGELAKLPEFTNLVSKAQQFGRNHFVGVFQIHVAYITKGSGTEGGWICKDSAPVTIVGWKEGEGMTPVLPSREVRKPHPFSRGANPPPAQVTDAPVSISKVQATELTLSTSAVKVTEKDLKARSTSTVIQVQERAKENLEAVPPPPPPQAPNTNVAVPIVTLTTSAAQVTPTAQSAAPVSSSGCCSRCVIL